MADELGATENALIDNIGVVLRQVYGNKMSPVELARCAIAMFSLTQTMAVQSFGGDRAKGRRWLQQMLDVME